MLITRTFLYLLTYLLSLLIGYLLAKDFRHYQKYHLHQMRQKDSRHQRETATCLVMSCLGQAKTNHPERKLREICFYFCTANKVTFVFNHICPNHSKSSPESGRHFFFPYSSKEKDYFKDCGAFSLSGENEPVTSNPFKRDFSHLRSIVSHQVPLPLITSGNDFSEKFLKELYRPRRLPVEKEFSVLQKYPRATNYVFCPLFHLKCLSSSHEFYSYVCLTESIKKFCLNNPLCKYKSIVDWKKLFSIYIVLKTESSSTESKKIAKCETVIIESKYFKELIKFLEHYLFCGRESTNSSKENVINAIKRTTINENIRNSKYSFKKYFDNLSISERKDANIFNDYVTIPENLPRKRIKSILSKQINIKERRKFNTTHMEGKNFINKSVSNNSIFHSPERKRRQISIDKNQELFEKLMKEKYMKYFFKNSTPLNSNHSSSLVSRVFKRPSTSHFTGTDFFKELVKKRSPTRFKILSSFNNIHKRRTRFKKSLFTLGAKSIAQNEATTGTNVILGKRKSNQNSMLGALRKIPLLKNFGILPRTDFNLELNITGASNFDIFPKVELDARIDRRAKKPEVDFTTEKKIYFPSQDENFDINETSSKNQSFLYPTLKTTPSFSETESDLGDSFLRTLDKAKELSGTTEQQDILSKRGSTDTDEFNDGMLIAPGLTEDGFSDIDKNIIKNEVSPTKINNGPYTEDEEMFTLGREISPLPEISVKFSLNTLPNLELPTEESVDTAGDVSSTGTRQNVGMKTDGTFTSEEFNTDGATDDSSPFPLSTEQDIVTGSEEIDFDGIISDKPVREGISTFTEIQEIFSSEEDSRLIPEGGGDYDGSLTLDFSSEGNQISSTETLKENSVTYDFYPSKPLTVSSPVMSTTSSIQNELNEGNYVPSSERHETTFSTKDEGKEYFNGDSTVSVKDLSTVTDAIEVKNKDFDTTETTSKINRGSDSSDIDLLFDDYSFSTDQLEISSGVSAETFTTTYAAEKLSTTESGETVMYRTETKEGSFTENEEEIIFTTTERSTSFDSFDNDKITFPSKEETYPITSGVDLNEIDSISTESFSNVSSIPSTVAENLTNEMPIEIDDMKLDKLSTTDSVDLNNVNSKKNATPIYFGDETFSPTGSGLNIFSEKTVDPSMKEIMTGSDASTNSEKPVEAKTVTDLLKNGNVDNTQVLSTSSGNILTTSDGDIQKQDEVTEITAQELSLSSERDLSVSVQELLPEETSLKIDTGIPSSSNSETSYPFTMISEFSTKTIETTLGDVIPSPSDNDFPFDEVLNPEEVISSSTDGNTISSGDMSTPQIEIISTGTENEVPLSKEKDESTQADDSAGILKEETLIRTDRDVISASEEDVIILLDESSKPLTNEIKTTSEKGLFSSSDYGALIPDSEEYELSKDDDVLKTSTERELLASSDDGLMLPGVIGTVSTVSEKNEIPKTTSEKGLFSTENNGLLIPDNEVIDSSSMENGVSRTSSEKDLISSSDYSLLEPDETATDIIANENDEDWISTENEIFTSSKGDELISDTSPINEEDILDQDDKTTYSVKEVIRTERQILSSSEDVAPVEGIVTENEDIDSILPVTFDTSTDRNYPKLPTESEVNPEISNISPGLTNLGGTSMEGTSDVSFEADAGVSVNVNKDISTEFHLKTSLQNTPPNGNSEGSTELNTIEKTSLGGDEIDASMEILPDDGDLSPDPDLLSTPSSPIPNINIETEETPPDTTEKEMNIFPQVFLSPTAPKSTDETDSDYETTSEDVDKTDAIITTPKSSTTKVFEKYSTSTSTSEQTIETITTEKNVPSSTSPTSLRTSTSERFSSTASLTSLRTSTSDISFSSTTSSTSLKPSTTVSSTTSSTSLKPSTTISSTEVSISSQAYVPSSTKSADETTQPSEMTQIPFFFTIDADYDEVVGTRKKEFEESLTEQLVVVMRIPIQCLQNLQVSKGSVNVNFELVPSPDHGHMADEKALKAAADELKRMIDNGQLNINDLDGNTLVIVPMDPPTKAPAVNQTENITIILGVVLGAFILIVISVAVAAIIIKRKANGSHRLTPIEEMRGKLPSYREIPFQEALFVKGSSRNKLMLGKYCYNTGQWMGPGPEPVLYHPPDSVVYRPPTDSEIRQTPRPPTAVLDACARNFIGDHGPRFGHPQVEQMYAASRS